MNNSQDNSDLPTNFRSGEIIIRDRSTPTPKEIVFQKTEGNFAWNPGDVEEIDVFVRGEVDGTLDGKNGITTFQFTGHFNGAKSNDDLNPKPYQFVGTGEMIPSWTKYDNRIQRPNYLIIFRNYGFDGETITSEVQFPGATLRGGVKEGNINEISISGRCPRYFFPVIAR